MNYLLESVHLRWLFEVTLFMELVVDMLNILQELESSKNEFFRLSYKFSKLRVLQQEILEYAAQSVRFCFYQQFSLYKFVLQDQNMTLGTLRFQIRPTMPFSEFTRDN